MSKTPFVSAKSPRRQGSVLILAAGAVVMVCGFTAMAVDYGLLSVDANRLQRACDAAALAGAAKLDQSGLKAIDYINARVEISRVAAANGVPIDWNSPDIEFPEDNNTKVKVKASYKRSFFFAPILGIKDGTISRSATAGITTIGYSGAIPVVPIGITWETYMAYHRDYYYANPSYVAGAVTSYRRSQKKTAFSASLARAKGASVSQSLFQFVKSDKKEDPTPVPTLPPVPTPVPTLPPVVTPTPIPTPVPTLGVVPTREIKLIRQNKNIFTLNELVLFDLRDKNGKSGAQMETQLAASPSNRQVTSIGDSETTLNANLNSQGPKFRSGLQSLFNQSANAPWNDSTSASAGSRYYDILSGAGRRDNPRVVYLVVTPSTTVPNNGTYDAPVRGFVPVYIEGYTETSNNITLNVRFLPPEVVSSDGATGTAGGSTTTTRRTVTLIS